MDYEYDVFVSYKRYKEWTSWVRDDFVTMLDHHLSNELGKPARIFVDDQIETGSLWEPVLADALVKSRVLVPLFSKMYFSSQWCIRELYAMRFKQQQLGLPIQTGDAGIVVPARIHDGLKRDLPGHLHGVCDVQAVDLTKFALINVKQNGSLHAEFEQAIRQMVQGGLVSAIRSTRDFDARWLDVVHNRTYDCPEPAQYDHGGLPRLSGK